MADIELMHRKYENAEEQLINKYDMERVIEEESLLPKNFIKHPRSISLKLPKGPVSEIFRS